MINSYNKRFSELDLKNGELCESAKEYLGKRERERELSAERTTREP